VDAYEPQVLWPARAAVLDYRDRVRAELGSALSERSLPRDLEAVASMVVEHELMHQETLLYMLQELDHGLKRRPFDWPALPGPGAQRRSRSVDIPEGDAVLGASPGSLSFGWDNEFRQHSVHVPAFAIDETPVTNADLLEFVEDRGYAESRLWSEDGWAWRSRRCLNRPHSWRRDDSGVRIRGLLEDVPFERAACWPALVSWAEASAYARWRGQRLPSEAEWHRAARGTPAGRQRSWPWGDEAPGEAHGNFHFRHASPEPVGSHPAGASAWGVQELIGNGWEWTGTPFAPFPGFEPLPRYPGYSADFFDGRHFVLRGGSWATDEILLRPSFRNWFQPHYPYVFSKFRCARSL
jgi:ergothioneine biosynthesis protein EgtB